MSIELILTEVFSITDFKNSDDLELRGIPLWDSMSHMILIMQIEEKFNIELSGDEIANLRTVGDIRVALRKRNVTV